MRTLPALEIARDNALFGLKRALAFSRRSGHGDAGALADIAVRFHALGIVALLADGNPGEFARMLALSGQADLQCRQLDLTREPRLFMASRSIPFHSALAAGDLSTAAAIAERCPDRHQEGFEYEDDYLKHRFLQRLILTPEDEAGLLALLDRWDRVAERKPPPSHALSRAIVARDARAFDNAMDEMIARRADNLKQWRKSPAYKVEDDALLGPLSVDGLAYLRLAELRKLPTQSEYDTMPSVARVKLGTPLPPPGAWQQFDPTAE